MPSEYAFKLAPESLKRPRLSAIRERSCCDIAIALIMRRRATSLRWFDYEGM